MKSLILKDLYNIVHNAKCMLIILAMLSASFTLTSGVSDCIFMCSIICSMMTVTTFSFDDSCNWEKYALIMPVSKNDLVAGKFVVSVIFSVSGSLFGLVFGSIVGIIKKEIAFNLSESGNLLLVALCSAMISLIFSSMSIPLVFKFGAEKGRILLIASFLVPSAICFGVYKLLEFIGVEITEQHLFLLMCCSPLFAVIWCFAMYKISCGVFSKKEL